MAVTNDLATDRRVLRHAAALRDAGCEVSLVGREREVSLPLPKEWDARRLRVKWNRGWRFYAAFNWSLFKELRKRDADILWANDSDTLPGCWLAAKWRGRKLVMDAHELFPEVPEIQGKPLVKWIWRTVERLLMPQCDWLLTVCDSIAEYYRQELGVSMGVVRNMQERREENTAAADGMLSSLRLPHSSPILLYQGAVNLGRGVDWAIDALEWLPECQLVVAGDGDKLEEMRRYAAEKPWSGRVTFTGRLTPAELEVLTRKAAVGLVMLEDLGLSYHYALPNRIGDFVAAGVPMVVSDLPEMARVVKRFKVGEVMRDTSAKALAESVERVLARKWEETDFAAARKDMNWEREKEKLQEVVRWVN